MSVVGYGKFCQALLDGDEDAKVLLAYHHLFLRTGNFDPLTGEGLPTDLDALLTGIARFSREKPHFDRLCRLEAHCGAALLQLLKTPHESLQREYAMLPLHSVREMDAHTVAWLGRQPGKTLAQKLAGKRSMKAIRRRWVLDSAENRLLKAFLRTFVETMEVRGRALGFGPEEESAEWQKAARRWLGSVGVEEIGKWNNTPPNNVLLSHKHYRKIWDAWCWLLELDREIARDFEKIRSITLELLFWRMAAYLHEKDFRLLQSVCFFRMPRFRFGMSLATDDLDIRGRCKQGDEWRDLRLALANGVLQFSIGGDEIFHAGLKGGRLEIDYSGTTRPLDTLEDITRLCSPPETTPDVIAEGAVGALDCCELEPFFRLDEGTPSRLPFRLLAQENAQPPLLLDCGNAKALRIGIGQSLFSFHDIFLGTGDQLNQRASFLFERVRKFLHCRHLYLVTPDNIDEFRLGAVNRRACATFPSAQTIPRSISAIFSILKKAPDIFAAYDRLGVVVCYFYGNNFLLTLLRGKKSPFLESNVPECGGFVWERFPTWAVPWRKGLEAVQKNPEHEVLKLTGRPPLELASLAGGVSFFHAGKDESLAAFELETDLGAAVREAASNVAIPPDVWEKTTTPATAEGYPLFLLLSDFKIHVSGIPLPKIYGPVSALRGAAALARWQRKWPETEFWKEHLPDLLMCVPADDGRRKFWSLVKNVSIRATPGAVKEIHLADKEIELSASGNDAYYFPLKREEGGSYLSYVAKLTSRYFPLSNPARFKLRLRYAYGAENPYTLELIPTDGVFPEKLTVQWLSEETMPKNSPAPAFPSVDDWASQEHFVGKYEPENLVKEFSGGFVRSIHEKVLFYKKDPQARRVYWPDFGPDTEWIKDSYCFFKTSDKKVLVHKNNFYDWDGTQKYPVNQGGISFDIEENRKRPGGFFAKRVTPGFSFPPLMDKDNDLDEADLQKQNKSKKALRFRAQHLWNYGRSLSDADAPPALRQTIMQFSEDVHWLIKMKLLTKEEFFVCVDIFARMHADAPAWIWNALKSDLDARNSKRVSNIGYALGDLRLDEQRRLLSRLLDAAAGDFKGLAFFALSIALWRAPIFVSKLSREQLAGLADNLLEYFRSRLDTLDRHGHAMTVNDLKYFERGFQQICEILLALLRSRSFEDDETKKLLNANGELAKNFMEEIERLIVAQGKYGFKMRSFVNLELDKPESCRNMPDILFAVDRYLSGDVSSAYIRITSLSDEM